VLDGLPLAARLEDDDVERRLAHALDRQVVHVLAPRQGAAAAAVVLRPAGIVDEIEVVRHLRQVVEVVAVHVPRQDAQAPLHDVTPPIACSTARRGPATASSAASTASGVIASAQAWPIGHCAW